MHTIREWNPWPQWPSVWACVVHGGKKNVDFIEKCRPQACDWNLNWKRITWIDFETHLLGKWLHSPPVRPHYFGPNQTIHMNICFFFFFSSVRENHIAQRIYVSKVCAVCVRFEADWMTYALNTEIESCGWLQRDESDSKQCGYYFLFSCAAACTHSST